MFHSSRAHCLSMITALLLSVAAGGCDEIGPCCPVEGQILLNGKPTKALSGTVLFVPDTAKGNTSSFRAGGEINAEGRYRLSTHGKPGAPAGWYKVVVSAVPPGTGDRDVVRRPPLHSRYTAEKTTSLSVQVVAGAAPGAYDLKVTRN